LTNLFGEVSNSGQQGRKRIVALLRRRSSGSDGRLGYFHELGRFALASGAISHDGVGSTLGRLGRSNVML
jgi:hypothetical protein